MGATDKDAEKSGAGGDPQASSANSTGPVRRVVDVEVVELGTLNGVAAVDIQQVVARVESGAARATPGLPRSRKVTDPGAGMRAGGTSPGMGVVVTPSQGLAPVVSGSASAGAASAGAPASAPAGAPTSSPAGVLTSGPAGVSQPAVVTKPGVGPPPNAPTSSAVNPGVVLPRPRSNTGGPAITAGYTPQTGRQRVQTAPPVTAPAPAAGTTAATSPATATPSPAQEAKLESAAIVTPSGRSSSRPPRAASLPPPPPSRATLPPPEPSNPTPGSGNDSAPLDAGHPLGWLDREVRALAKNEPGRAAVLCTVAAWLAADSGLPVRPWLARAEAANPSGRAWAFARRWIALRAGDASGAAKAADEEFTRTSDPRDRAVLLSELAAASRYAGVVAQVPTGANDGAPVGERATLEGWLALAPREPVAWDLAAGEALRDRRWEDAAKNYEGLAEALDDGSARASALTFAATLREARAGDENSARALLGRAVEADAAHPGALAALEPLLLRAGEWVTYARCVSAQAESLGGDPSGAREALERAGNVWWEVLGDAESAAASFERASAIAPREPGPLARHVAVLEGSGRYADAPRVYERSLAVLREPGERAAALLRQGLLLELRLGDREGAQRAYARSLAESPALGLAERSLSRVYALMGRWNDWVALGVASAERVRDRGVRAARLVALALRCEYALNDRPTAQALYERAVNLDPTHAGAAETLALAYRVQGRHDALATMLEGRYGALTDERSKGSIARTLGELYLDVIRDPLRAIEWMRRATTHPEDPALSWASLARALAADPSRGSEYADAVAQQALRAQVPSERLALRMHHGALLEHRVRDVPRALEAYRAVLAEHPGHAEALSRVSQVLLAEGRFAEAVTALRAEISANNAPEEQGEQWASVALLEETALGSPERSAAAWREALNARPDDAAYADGLERVLRPGVEGTLVREAREARARAAKDPTTRARWLCAAAVAAELQERNPALAQTLYAHALEENPSHDDARWGLLRLSECEERWGEAAQHLLALRERASHSSAKLRLLARLALRSAARDPGADEVKLDPEALLDEALTLGQASDVLAPERVFCARASGAEHAVVHGAAVASRLHDARWTAGIFRDRGASFEWAGGDPDETVEAYEQALHALPGDAASLEGAGRSAWRTGAQWERAAGALAARAAQIEDAGTASVAHLVAGRWFETAERPAEAEAQYLGALARDVRLTPAYVALATLREHRGDYAGARDARDALAQHSADPQHAADELVVAAALSLEHLEDPAGALDRLKRAIEFVPGHDDAYEHARSLMESQRDAAGLAALLAHRTLGIKDPSERARLLIERSAVVWDGLGDTRGALADLRSAAQSAPNEPEVLAALARGHGRAQQWSESVDAWASTLAALTSFIENNAHPWHGQALTLYREAVLAQARVFSAHVPDPARAALLLEPLLAHDPGDREAVALLAKASLAAGDPRRARDLYALLARDGKPADRASALLELAEASRAGLRDAPAAHAAAGEAFALAIVDPAVVPMLEAHYARTEDWGAFGTLGDEALTNASGLPVPAVHSPSEMPGELALRIAVARAFAERLGALDASERHLRAAVERFPRSVAPQLALARSLVGVNDHAALRAFRAAADLDATDPRAHRGLAELSARSRLPACAALSASASALLGEVHPTLIEALARAPRRAPPPGALPSDEALLLLCGPTRARTARAVLSLLDPHLHAAYPTAPELLSGLTRIPDGHPAHGIVRAVAAALGPIEPPVLLRGTSRDAGMLLLTQPAVLVLGPEHLAEGSEARVWFDAAHACARLAAGSVCGQVLAPEVLTGLLEAALNPDPSHDTPMRRDARQRLAATLPKKVRKDLERLGPEAAQLALAELPAWHDEERRRALRAGLVFARDLRSVAQTFAPELLVIAPGSNTEAHQREHRRRAGSNPPVLDALHFSATEACWAVVQRLVGAA